MNKKVYTTANGKKINMDALIAQNENPIASSITVPSLTNSNTMLQISMKGVEYNGSSWSNLSGDKTVHLFISIIRIIANCTTTINIHSRLRN